LPILLTHMLSGIAVMGAIALVYRHHSPKKIYVVGVLFFILPDLDHLLTWQPSMLGYIFPVTLWDLLKDIFVPRHPLLLHNWIFPASLAVLTVVGFRYGWSMWKLLAILTLGWAVHLLLDGVLLI